MNLFYRSDRSLRLSTDKDPLLSAGSLGSIGSIGIYVYIYIHIYIYMYICM
jgi:hypothetical protein